MEYKILDTGYISADVALTSQTQLSDGERAGNTDLGYVGSIYAFTLGGVLSTSFGGSNNINDSPQIGTKNITNTGSNSIENEMITIQFAYKRNSQPIPTTGRTFYKSFAWEFNNLKYTDGIKLIYPSGNGTMSTALMQIGEYYKGGIFSEASPSDDEGTVSSTTPYIPVIITDINFQDNPQSDFIRVSVTCKRTN